MNKKSSLGFLSTAAIAGIMVSAVSSTAYAKVTDAVMTGTDGNIYRYNYDKLGDSLAGDGVYFNDFAAKLNGGAKVTSYLDDKTGYVKANSVIDAVIGQGKDFTQFADSAATSDLTTVDTSKLYDVAMGTDGKPVANPVQQAVTVSSVSAITATDVTVTLPTGFDATAAADVKSYSIAINGAAAVNPTAVTVDATAKTAKLSIALAGQQGSLTVNGVAGTSANSTDKFDYQKPTITNVQALNNKTILVTYSEPVADSALTVTGKYSLYNKTNGATNNFVATANPGDLTAVAAFANADKTQIKFTISANTVAGFPQGGLANAGYIFYATGVDDKAAVANTIVAASPMEFNGTLTPDTAAANAVSATYNRGNGQIVLSFDKAVTGTPADDVIYLQVGTNKVLLKAADYASISGAGTTTITINPTQTTIDAINALGANPQIVLGDAAFTTSAAGTVTPVVASAPTVSSVSYDDVTNRITFTFSEPINVAKFATALSANKVAIQTTAGDTWAAVNGALVTPVNSATVTVAVDQTTARALEAITIAQPKLRLTLNAAPQGAGAQNLENITDIETAAATPVQFVEKDYSGIVTLNKTPLSIVSAQYTEADHKLKLTFNKDVKVDVDDSTKISVYTDNTLSGIIGTDAATPLAIASDETTNDGKTLTYTIAATSTSNPNVALAATEATAIKNGTSKLYVTVGTGAVTEQGGQTTFAVPVANKVAVTYVATPAATPAATVTTADGSNYVEVKFDQVVDKTTAETLSNYIAYLVSDPTVTFNFDSATLLSDQQTVYLHSTTPLTLADTSYKIGIKNVAAKVGGAVMTSTYAYADSQALTTGTVVGAPILTKADLTGTGTLNVNMTEGGAAGLSSGDKFVLTFNKPVTAPATVSGVASGAGQVFTLANGTKLGTGNVTIEQGAYANQLVVTLADGYDVATTEQVGLFTGQTAIKFVDGTTAAVGTGEAKQVLLAPTTATEPKVKIAVYADANGDGTVDAGDTVTITMDQSLNTAGTLVTNMTASNAGNAATFGLPANTSFGDAATYAYSGTDTIVATLGGNGIRLNSANAYGYLGTDMTVKAGDNAGTYTLQNNWLVKANAGGTAVAVTSADTIKPAIQSVSYGSESGTNYLYIKMSKAVNVSNTPTFGDAFTVDSATGTIATADALSISSTDPTVVKVALTDGGDTVVKGLTNINIKLGATKVNDASGNVIVKSNTTGYVVQP